MGNIEKGCSEIARASDFEETDLFQVLEDNKENIKSRSYLPSFLVVAGLPLRDTKKPIFNRKFNGYSLSLMGSPHVPYGKYARLLLSVVTTHAVIEEKNKGEIVLHYNSLGELLEELQLPKQRGKEVLQQLSCFSQASFSFEHKETVQVQKSLFDEYKEDGEVKITKISTGTIPFFAMQYIRIEDDSLGEEKRNKSFNIVLQEKFIDLCKEHAVPICYTDYKNITSPLGKDLYAWLVYRNNSISSKEGVFIPREQLINQFLPINSEGSSKTTESERMNYNYYQIKERLKEIKLNYYKDLNIDIDGNPDGITIYKSPSLIAKEDVRYILVTN